MKKGSIVILTTFDGKSKFNSLINLSFLSVYERLIILEKLSEIQLIPGVNFSMHHVPTTPLRDSGRFNRRKGRKYFNIPKNGILKLSAYQASRFYYSIRFEMDSSELLEEVIGKINNILLCCNFISGELNRCQGSYTEDNKWYFVTSEHD